MRSKPLVRFMFAVALPLTLLGGSAAGQNKAELAGFKVLRLNESPQVPPMAPQPRPTRPF